MSEPNAISDTQPSPWVACPRCGDVWLKLTGVLERGTWQDEQTYVVDLTDPPVVGGYRSSSPDIECGSCGHRFGLADVGYSVRGSDG